MKTIHFIRHAESQANAREATQNDESITLTKRGEQQAIDLGNSISGNPDLIICSKFIRTQKTAAPLIRKHPQIPVKILPIHEFSCLSPATCAGTTPKQRKNQAAAYWEQAGRRILQPIYPKDRPLPAMHSVFRSPKHLRFYPRARPARHLATTNGPPASD